MRQTGRPSNLTLPWDHKHARDHADELSLGRRSRQGPARHVRLPRAYARAPPDPCSPTVSTAAPLFVRRTMPLNCLATQGPLGTTLQVPTLEADLGGDDPDLERSIDLEIKPGTQSGASQTMEARGVPGSAVGRGDLIVTVLGRDADPARRAPGGAAARVRGDPGRGAPDGQFGSPQKSVFGRLRDAFHQHG